MISHLLLSFLVATASADYIFNGFRGLIPATTTTSNNNNNNNNNVNSIFSNNLQNNLVNHRQDNTLTTIINNNKNGRDNSKDSKQCVQRSSRDFRPVPGSCSQFVMCSSGELVTFNCPVNTVFNELAKSCVPKGSRFDTCSESQNNVGLMTPGARPQPASQLSILCPRGVTYKKAHPVHCARYYDCGRPAMMDRWEDHEWECKYPFLFNENTKRCEHYSMVSCGTRKIAYDRCDYKAYGCNGHAHCRPCEVQFPSCRNLADGMNVWQGRTPSPYYVVCASHRVVYSGSCPDGQLFNGKTGTCTIASRSWF